MFSCEFYKKQTTPALCFSLCIKTNICDDLVHCLHDWIAIKEQYVHFCSFSIPKANYFHTLFESGQKDKHKTHKNYINSNICKASLFVVVILTVEASICLLFDLIRSLLFSFSFNYKPLWKKRSAMFINEKPLQGCA